ncbi:MAG: hypothetical protein AB8G99_21525 [Planctomycetaceae bacterium]
MCIFSQPVVSVTDTSIFARLMPNGWQHLVYQMKFETRAQNAIILPLPVALPSAEESLQFVSLKGYDRFFADLNRGFPLATRKSRSFSRGLPAGAKVDSKIVVHEVGDFVASFVPTIADFDRLDEQFRVPDESWGKIPIYRDYGFAVFQLKSNKGKPHPMAFKFKSRLAQKNGGSIFFPTVHIHDGEVHEREKFDHTLFLQAPEFDKVCGDYQQRAKLVADRKTGYFRSKWPAARFCNVEKSKGIVAPGSLVHRLEMRGKLKNTDVLAHADLSHVKKTNTAAGLGLPGSILGLAGFKWFCDRRDHVAQQDASQ